MKPSFRNNRSDRIRTPEEVEADRLKAENLRLISEGMQAKWKAELEEESRRKERMESILKFLNIPLDGSFVDATTLVDILMDDEKAKEIFTKLRNKAFW